MKVSVLSKMAPQYIVDDKGNKTSVVLDLKTFTNMVEELEDLYDAIEAEKVLACGKEEEGSTLDDLEKSLNDKSKSENF
jgi:hypothetical protein